MTVAPIYLQEIAPSGWSQIFGVSFSLGLNFGTLIGQVFGLKEILGSVETWQYIFVIGALPSASQLFCSIFTMESPVFLKRNYSEEMRTPATTSSISSKSQSTKSLIKLQSLDQRCERFYFMKNACVLVFKNFDSGIRDFWKVKRNAE